MQKLDVPPFAASLNAIAEVFDKKAVTPKALEVWFDTLREFDTNRVLSLLNTWPKTHSKFPAPNDVWKALNEDASGTRERVAQAEKAAFAQGARQMGATEHGRQKLAEIYVILGTPKPSPLEHWTRVRNDHTAPAIAKRFADSYLAKRAMPEREPGQDDEERAA